MTIRVDPSQLKPVINTTHLKYPLDTCSYATLQARLWNMGKGGPFWIPCTPFSRKFSMGLHRNVENMNIARSWNETWADSIREDEELTLINP